MYNGKITLWSYSLPCVLLTGISYLPKKFLVYLTVLGSFHSTCQKMLERGEGNEGSRLMSVCVKYHWAHFLYDGVES